MTPPQNPPGATPPLRPATAFPAPTGRRPIGFMGSVNVLTESGSLEISKIVKKCLPIRVACSDPETGRFDYRPVTDWTCRRGNPLDLVLLVQPQ